MSIPAQSANPPPRLTIGLPVFNGEAYLEETLQALLRQTYPEFALLVGDNASTDRTQEIARDFATSDSRIRYVRNERNLGLAANYNALFDRATSELFKWAPADDTYEPRYLERCIAALDEDERAVLAYCRARFIDAAGQPLEIEDPGWDLRQESAADRFLYAVYAEHWVNSIIGVIRRKALAETRLMPRYPGGDFVLLGELSLHGTFLEVPEPFFFRRIHPKASSQIRLDPDRIRQHVSGPDRKPSWPRGQRTFGHLATIVSSRRLDWRTRARLLRGLARASAHRLPEMGRELATMLRWSSGAGKLPMRSAARDLPRRREDGAGRSLR